MERAGRQNEERKLYYFSSKEGDAVRASLMTASTADAALLQNSYVVEYDPVNCSVYAVFYAEDFNIAEQYQSHWALSTCRVGCKVLVELVEPASLSPDHAGRSVQHGDAFPQAL